MYMNEFYVVSGDKMNEIQFNQLVPSFKIYFSLSKLSKSIKLKSKVDLISSESTTNGPGFESQNGILCSPGVL